MKEYIKNLPKYIRRILQGDFRVLIAGFFLPYQYVVIYLGNWAIFSYFYLNRKFMKGMMKRRILQISPLTTKPYIISRVLQDLGYESHFLTIGDPSKYWLKYGDKGYDLNIDSAKYSYLRRPFNELFQFWKCVSHYDVFHYHFLTSFFPLFSFCELKYLKRLEKKIVFHFRGCDIRERAPTAGKYELSCCTECDYPSEACMNAFKEKNRRLAKTYGDLFLVTTPDLLQYIPEAHHLPFMRDLLDYESIPSLPKENGTIRIVHATNHDGIEGTHYVEEAAARLKSEGYPVELLIVRKVPHEAALQIFKSGDICVGKLMMGYYANFQIETMAMGKPTLCYIRDDLKPFASDCPIVNTTPKNVYENLKRLCEDRGLRESLGRKGMEFVRKEHDNLKIGMRLLRYYGMTE
jgi:hypothetical protein